MKQSHVLFVSTIFISSITAVMCSDIGLSEIVILKNGTSIKGSIAQMTDSEITIETADMGQLVIKRRTVQSITDTPPEKISGDGSGSIQERPLAAAAGTPQSININNNNNNNQNAATSAVATATPTEKQTAPLAATVVADSSNNNGFIFGTVNYGISNSNVKSPFGWVKNDELKAPLFHWDIIGYRFPSGFSMALFGEGTTSQKNGDLAKQSFLHGGLNTGWSSTPPALGHSGDFFHIGGTIGYASLTTVVDGYPVWDEHYIYVDYARGKVKQEGLAYGANVGYGYYTAGGLGFHIGVSAFQANLDRVTMDRSLCDDYDTDYASSTPSEPGIVVNDADSSDGSIDGSTSGSDSSDDSDIPEVSISGSSSFKRRNSSWSSGSGECSKKPATMINGAAFVGLSYRF